MGSLFLGGCGIECRREGKDAGNNGMGGVWFWGGVAHEMAQILVINIYRSFDVLVNYFFIDVH